MTKKDYELIAETIRQTPFDPNRQHALQQEYYAERVALRLANALAGTNPRFDRARFIAACKGEDSTDSAGRAVRYSRA